MQTAASEFDQGYSILNFWFDTIFDSIRFDSIRFDFSFHTIFGFTAMSKLQYSSSIATNTKQARKQGADTSALENITKSMKLRTVVTEGGGTGGGYGSVHTIAFWAWEAVVRVGRVLGSCTGADYESLIVWRGY
jgi:hypothetical protein